MVQTDKGKQHETFVPHVHPTTVDGLDLESGCTGGKENDNDEAARLKKMSIVLGVAFCLAVLVCGICVCGTAESTSCVTFHSFFLNGVGELISSFRGGIFEERRQPEIFCKGQRISVDMDTILGQGAAGVVFKAEMWNGQNEPKDVAVKVPIISEYFGRDGLEQSIARHDEVAEIFGQQRDDPRLQFLCKVYGTAPLTAELCGAVADSVKIKQSNIYEKVVILEFFPRGDLQNHLQTRSRYGQGGANGVMPLVDVMTAKYQLGCGLKLLHEKGYTHRDVKPDNIFVRNDGKGFSFALGDFDLMTEALEPHPGGTLAFLQPEAFDDRGGVVVLHPKRQDCYGLMLTLAYCAAPQGITKAPEVYNKSQLMQYAKNLVKSARDHHQKTAGVACSIEHDSWRGYLFLNHLQRLLLQKVKRFTTGKSSFGWFDSLVSKTDSALSRLFASTQEPEEWCASAEEFFLETPPQMKSCAQVENDRRELEKQMARAQAMSNAFDERCRAEFCRNQQALRNAFSQQVWRPTKQQGEQMVQERAGFRFEDFTNRQAAVSQNVCVSAGGEDARHGVMSHVVSQEEPLSSLRTVLVTRTPSWFGQRKVPP